MRRGRALKEHFILTDTKKHHISSLKTEVLSRPHLYTRHIAIFLMFIGNYMISKTTSVSFQYSSE